MESFADCVWQRKAEERSAALFAQELSSVCASQIDGSNNNRSSAPCPNNRRTTAASNMAQYPNSQWSQDGAETNSSFQYNSAPRRRVSHSTIDKMRPRKQRGNSDKHDTQDGAPGVAAASNSKQGHHGHGRWRARTHNSIPHYKPKTTTTTTNSTQQRDVLSSSGEERDNTDNVRINDDEYTENTMNTLNIYSHNNDVPVLHGDVCVEERCSGTHAPEPALIAAEHTHSPSQNTPPPDAPTMPQRRLSSASEYDESSSGASNDSDNNTICGHNNNSGQSTEECMDDKSGNNPNTTTYACTQKHACWTNSWGLESPHSTDWDIRQLECPETSNASEESRTCCHSICTPVSPLCASPAGVRIESLKSTIMSKKQKLNSKPMAEAMRNELSFHQHPVTRTQQGHKSSSSTNAQFDVPNFNVYLCHILDAHDNKQCKFSHRSLHIPKTANSASLTLCCSPLAGKGMAGR